MKKAKSYIFIVFILISMLVVLINYKLKEAKVTINLNSLEVKETENIKINTMDTGLLITILSTVGILAGVLFNPKLTKLETKLNDYQKENKEQHDLIQNDLKKLRVNYDLETSLREIVDGILEITSGKLSTFIEFEGTLFIDNVKEVISGLFNINALPSINTKLQIMANSSNNKAKELGNDFFNLHYDNQIKCIDQFSKEIEEVLMDDFFNTKHKRFKMICEQALLTHLKTSVQDYMKINMQ